MIPLHDLLLFALAALVLVLTPGPNMMYVVSRALLQGRRAGVLSLGGVLLGFLVHMLAASFGLSALLLAVPYAYLALKLAGATYLLWLAWQAVKPGGSSPFAPRTLPHGPAWRLVQMGFMTNLLNPKVAVFYLALLPQFIRPERGPPIVQSLVLGLTQISVSCLVNFSLVMTAGSVAAFLAARPRWARIQRQWMGAVLGGLALRLAFDHGR
ncbi:LysE family translocator [Deinococcus hopiensis]|uniref:Threonine/homoserine/homoserine lactone efflux protein n=1 Tax=Deinococcus hopiensis KR-140 TaxID=695939 RepID=A0A1W1VL66_9DEIO|nr:LysE family translocator [Deinococcus hopiensis]SMB94023.1 Threonine/homoserine/homoserine lactone efflux protein [Deinococcus hopiensis KR-140]